MMNENMVIDEKVLSENADFLRAVVSAKTIEEAQNICAEYNIDLPADAWEEVREACRNGKLEMGELSEDDLDMVSGGRVNGSQLIALLSGVAGFGGLIALGSPIGILVGCMSIGFLAYKTFH